MQEVLQLKSSISLKLGKNVGFGEWMIGVKSWSKDFIPFKLGGPQAKMAIWQ